MNIQAVAQRTGVPAATLRKWEQRYEVLKPERTAGAHRRYDENDVMRVEWLKARLAEGFRIGEAARLLGSVGGGTPLDLDSLVDEIVAAARTTDADRIEQALGPGVHALRAGRRDPPGRAAGPARDRRRLARGARLRRPGASRDRALPRSPAQPPRAGPRPGRAGRPSSAASRANGTRSACSASPSSCRPTAGASSTSGCDTPLEDAAAVAAEVGATLLCVSASTKERAAASRRKAGRAGARPAASASFGAGSASAASRRRPRSPRSAEPPPRRSP